MTNLSKSRDKTKDNTSEISIDSLKVRIPLEDISEVSEELRAKRLVVNSLSGEVEAEIKQRGLKIKENGVTTYYGIESQRTSYNEQKEFLVILFNSKILGSQYFQGITLQNIRLIYEKLSSLLDVSLTYETFLNSEATDVDFKKDLVNRNFEETIKTITANAKKHGRSKYGYNQFNKAKKKGIEFGSRKTATAGNPFLKFYAKALELEHNSNEFKGEYLNESQIDKDLIRVEFTIKNKKHFRRYKIEDTTLKGLLSLEAEKKETILKDVLSIHLEKRVKRRHTSENLSPTDIALVSLISMLMNKGMSYETIKENILIGVDKRSSKHSLKKRIDKLYFDTIKGSTEDNITKEQDRFFKEIGWS